MCLWKTISPKSVSRRQFMRFHREGSYQPTFRITSFRTTSYVSIYLLSANRECRFLPPKIMLSNLSIFVGRKTAKKINIFMIMRYRTRKQKSFLIKIQESGLWQLLKSEANNSCSAVTSLSELNQHC